MCTSRGRFWLIAWLLAFAGAGSAATYTPISQIMTALPNSPLLGQTVTIHGGVIVALPNGVVYVHALTADTVTGATNAMPIYGNTTACTQANDEIEATGVVKKLPPSTPADTSAVALEVTSCTVLGTTTFVTNAGTVPSFSTFQDGLALIGSTFNAYTIRDVSPSGGTWDDATATVTPDGNFYGVSNGVDQRVFRLPGIPPNEYVPATAPATVLRSPGHPELTLTDHKTLGAIVTSYTVGQTLVCGTAAGTPPDAPHLDDHVLMDWTEGFRRLMWFPNIACIDTSGYVGPVTAASPAGAGQINVATLDLFRFYDDQNDAPGAPVVTSAGYARRLAKAGMAIADIFSMPQIMAFQEVKNDAVLQQMADAAQTRATAIGKPRGLYAWYSGPGHGGKEPQNGFLTDAKTVDVEGVQEVGVSDTYLTAGGASSPLWDTRPLVLHALVKRARAPYALTLINVLFAPRDHIDDPLLGADVRARRGAQAQAVAALVQSYQAAGENVMVVGNFNANEFNDGFVDVVNAVRGQPADPSLVTLSTPTNVSPALRDLTLSVPAEQRYNVYVNGEAQSFEHILVSSNISAAVTQTHFTADYARENANLDTTPAGLTPHDGQLATLDIPQAKAAITVNHTLTFGDVTVGTTSAPMQVTIQANSDNDAAVNIQNPTLSGPNAADFHFTSACSSLTHGQSCSIAVTFSPSAVGPRSATLTIPNDSTNESSILVQLSGNGVLAVSLTPTTFDFGNVIVGQTSAPQVFTWKNASLIAQTISSVTLTGDFSMTANTCQGSVAPGASCAVSVVFSPTALGARSGSLVVATGSGSASTSDAAALTGTGVRAQSTGDFTISVSPDHGTTLAGIDNSTTVVLGSTGGFSGQLALSCTTDAVASTCDIPASVQLSSTTSLKVTVHTASKYTVIGYGGMGGRWYLLLFAFGCGVVVLRTRRRSPVQGWLMLIVLLGASLGTAGCSGMLPSRNTPYTEQGEYHYTISATDGTIAHSAIYTLAVKAKN